MQTKQIFRHYKKAFVIVENYEMKIDDIKKYPKWETKENKLRVKKLEDKISYHQSFIEKFEKILKDFKSKNNIDDYNWFYYNNFDQKNQLDIALDEKKEKSEKTVNRKIAPMNKEFEKLIAADFLGYLHGKKEYYKKLTKHYN